ncbi:MAG TPA: phosphodiester glycosidase family protein, partial [Tepidisphaeraceae bacterium]|nr:phosphodiester glycosidase family protein [Tepidisphaeraceae bacterium]
MNCSRFEGARCAYVLLSAGAVGLAAPVAHAAFIRSAQPFVGVTHHQYIQLRGDTTTLPIFPREIVVNILEVDVTTPGVAFSMQPGNGALPGEVTRQTTRAFVNSAGAQIGINGDFYDTAPPYPSQNGQFFTDVVHINASDGDVYSPAAGGEALFNITQNNVPSIRTAGAAGSTTGSGGFSLYNAIGGNQRILTNGVVSAPNDSYTNTLNPHTAIGVSQDQTRVFLLTVDGRQGDYSEGMFTTEMASLMRDFGAWDAINVDGGGSTTMVMDDSNDSTQNARVINSPADGSSQTGPGTERLIANSLAVFATHRAGYVPLPAIPYPGQTGVVPNITQPTMFDDFEGSRGRFTSTSSGSNGNIAAATSSSVDTTYSKSGNSALKLDIVNTNATPSRMQMRLLSGGGTAGNNLHDGKAMGSSGFFGFWLRLEPGNDPLWVASLLDDGTTTSNGLERSGFKQVIADGEWHLYEWALADPDQWNNFNAGNGAINGPNAFLDAIYFSSTPASSGGPNW